MLDVNMGYRFKWLACVLLFCLIALAQSRLSAELFVGVKYIILAWLWVDLALNSRF